MNRRELLLVGASTAATHTLLNLGCSHPQAAADQHGHAEHTQGGHTPSGHGHHEHNTAGEHLARVQQGEAKLVAAVAECGAAGELCLTHCITRLSQGDSSLGECAARVRDMLAVCQATSTLAASGSPLLPALKQVCNEACGACAEACAPHSKHHAECAACLRACRAVQQVLAAS